jgi:dTDP-4-dehydrorhamnose 3,5-epimerase
VQCRRLAIPDVKLIKPLIMRDARGSFSETYVERALVDFGIHAHFVQENHSVSDPVGVVRGLHFQIIPHEQDKLVRVIRGAALDVAVDIRIGSPTFGKHVAVELSAVNRLQLWVPKGFAHGFCTLEPHTEVLYKTTAYYDRGSERGVRWNDPNLLIQWPIAEGDALLSPRDRLLPRLAQLEPCVRFSTVHDSRVPETSP